MWPAPQGSPYQRLGPKSEDAEVVESFKSWVLVGSDWVTTRGISLGVLQISTNKNKL